MPSPQSTKPRSDLPANLEICPDCEKPTAQIYMRDLTPEKRVCAWCFAHHEKEVTVDRTELGGKSLSERQVTTGMIKIAVAAVVLLGSGIYLILNLAGGSKAPESEAVADATPGGAAAKGADNKKDAAKPGSADSKAPGAKDATSQANNGAPGDKKPGAPGTPGSPSSVTTTAGAAAKADGTGNSGTSSATATNDDSKNGGKSGAPGSKDKKDAAAGGGPASSQTALAMSKGANAKPDDTTPTPFKRGDGASSEDTIKQIEKMIPKTAKNKRPEPTDPAEDGSPSDPDQKDGEKGALATEAADGKGGDPVDPKSAEAKKNANAALSQLSNVASKSTEKLSGMAGVASALTEVATRFAPKVKLADGVQRTKARHSSTNSEQDMSLDGGKGEDIWDQLMDEAGNPTAAGIAARKANGGANGSQTPEEAAEEAKRLAGGTPKAGSVAAANLAANTAKNGPVAKPAPGKTATTAITPATAKLPAAPKQTQLNSGVIALNAAGEKPANGNAIAIGSATGANGAAGAKSTPGGVIAVSATPKPATGVPATPPKSAQTELHLNQAIVIGKVDSVDMAPGATALTQKTVNAQLAKIPTALKGAVTVMSLKGDVLFEFGSTTLGDSAGAELDKVADTLAKHPNLPVLIRGYTDAVGSEKSNLAVSTKRAEAVRDWLVKKSGISAKNVTVIGMGASEPVAANKDEKGNDSTQGRAKNRRVTVTLPKIPETTTAAASPMVNGGNGATSAQ